MQMNDDLTYSGRVMHQPANGTGGTFVGDNTARDQYIYQTRIYPLNKQNEQYRTQWWKIYTTFASDIDTVADDCDGAYKTSLFRMHGLWAAQYSIPMSIPAWTVI